MAKKKTEPKTVHPAADPNVMGLRGTVVALARALAAELTAATTT